MAKEGQAKVLSDAEMDVFIDYLSKTRHSERDLAIWAVSRFAGLRVGSIAGLTLNDVIDENTGELKEVFVLRKAITKGKKTLVGFFGNPFLREVVSAYLKIRPECESDALFITERKVAFSPNVMAQMLLRHYNKAGLKGASSHSGRIGFASEKLKKGADIVAVSKLLGHSSITTTQRYVIHNQDELLNITRM